MKQSCAVQDAVAMEADVHYKDEELNNDNDGVVWMHGDEFTMESRIDVVQDTKAMWEHKVHVEGLEKWTWTRHKGRA